MPAKERTFSFRAAEDLTERLESVRLTWTEIAQDDFMLAELGREFNLQIVRRLLREEPDLRGQSDVIRAAVETLVAASERVREQAALTEEYARWAAEDAEGDEFRGGALRAGTEIWNDG